MSNSPFILKPEFSINISGDIFEWISVKKSGYISKDNIKIILNGVKYFKIKIEHNYISLYIPEYAKEKYVNVDLSITNQGIEVLKHIKKIKDVIDEIILEYDISNHMCRKSDKIFNVKIFFAIGEFLIDFIIKKCDNNFISSKGIIIQVGHKLKYKWYKKKLLIPSNDRLLIIDSELFKYSFYNFCFDFEFILEALTELSDRF